MELTQERINEIYLEVQRLAVTDEDFREQLLQNPNAAIEKVAGFELPESFKFNIVEHDPAYIATFALPPVGLDEISDEDLEKVAGGIYDVAALGDSNSNCNQETNTNVNVDL